MFYGISTLVDCLMPNHVIICKRIVVGFWAEVKGNEQSCGNLLNFLLKCGTRPYERGTQ